MTEISLRAEGSKCSYIRWYIGATLFTLYSLNHFLTEARKIGAAGFKAA